MKKKPKVVLFRRARKRKTDYRKRIRFLSAGKPRLVIRISLKKIITQVIDYHQDGDRVLCGLTSEALEKTGWKGSKKNLPAAYLTGYALAKECGKKKIKEVILDIGFKPSIKGNRIYAFVAGAIEGGLEMNCDKKMLPSEDRIKGKHIKPEIEKMFEEVKGKLK